MLTPSEARYTMCESCRRRTRVLCAGRPPGDKSAARVPRASLTKEEAPPNTCFNLAKDPYPPIQHNGIHLEEEEAMDRKWVVRGCLALSGLVLAACGAPAYDCPDAISCVDVAPGDPIHIGYAMVISGPDATLGLDTQYGAELAIDDRGGELLGHPIKFDGQDAGCNAEGGTAASTKLA